MMGQEEWRRKKAIAIPSAGVSAVCSRASGALLASDAAADTVGASACWPAIPLWLATSFYVQAECMAILPL